MRRKQAEALWEQLVESLQQHLYGRNEKDIELIIKTMFEYRIGKLKSMPIAVFNKMCPTLPKGQDYTVYDDEIRKKISIIQDDELRSRAESAFLDPHRFSTVRQTRNLHQFQLLGKIATISQNEFDEFVIRYFGEERLKTIYNMFGIPVPFLWAPREDDDYPYFE
jgi:hypothetical protein